MEQEKAEEGKVERTDKLHDHFDGRPKTDGVASHGVDHLLEALFKAHPERWPK